MKISVITLFLLFSLFCSCRKDTGAPVVPVTTPGQPTNAVLMLKIDYTSGKFQAAKVIKLKNQVYTGDTICLRKTYKSPGDFGNITFVHSLTGDTLFDGCIIWAGTGYRRIPAQLDTATNFHESTVALPAQPATRFRQLHPSVPDPLPWSAVEKLDIVKQFAGNNKKDIGYFLYQPSVGMGNPLEWYWVVFLSN